MTKYFLNRLIKGIVDIIIVVAIVMILIYSVLDRNLIFKMDSVYTKMQNNSKTTYKYTMWETYGYLDYVPYSDYIQELVNKGEITDEETRASAVNIGKTEDAASDIAKQYMEEFKNYYTSKGYKIVRLDAVLLGPKKYNEGGKEALFAYRDVPVLKRLGTYFKNLVTIDNIHNAAEVEGKRGLTFTFFDPVYGGKKFSPAIIGNGTTHRYLLYVDNRFPFIHQNLINISLGVSYSINTGKDVYATMTSSQGKYVKRTTLFPTGLVESSADDLHTATYSKGSRELNPVLAERFDTDYTNVLTVKKAKSKLGFSFVLGIFASLLAYLIGVPMGIATARRKDKLVDQIGTAYIVFATAVPSLAYIFMVKAIGRAFGAPTTFDMDHGTVAMYILPIISLAIKEIASVIRWLRRYMIDQMNSDYVKFARSGGLTEREIFLKHILKNAAIPIVHGIPATFLFAMTGAIMTERVYVVPGAGNLLTDAIGKYDNGVIIGVVLFYAVLSVASLILGDILMAIVDPRISFSSKDR